MKRMKYKGKIMILAILSTLVLCSFPSSSQQSLASTNSADGFIIEAEEITGTLGVPLIVSGDTSSRKGVPMIDLAMDHVEVKGLVIKKVTQTPNGPLTTVIKSNGTAKLNKMRVRITNLEFGGIFIPKLGYLGMKKVKLLAHRQTADFADLPSFSFSFDSKVGSQPDSKNEEELKELIKDLQQATTGEEEKEETGESEEQNKEEPEQDDKSDKPKEEQPAVEPEQPETETPPTEPETEPTVPDEPNDPDEGIENPDAPQEEEPVIDPPANDEENDPDGTKTETTPAPKTP